MKTNLEEGRIIKNDLGYLDAISGIAKSTNEAVNTAHRVSTVSIQVNASNSTNIDNLSNAVICAFFASQPNYPQLVHEDLQQIHPDDMEEMDLNGKWPYYEEIGKADMLLWREPQRGKIHRKKNTTFKFMRPFGVPVTILNTIDHLGKFNGKDDDGVFVGYSLNSKAFIVFNSRTRIVEEYLHTRFSESTPNVVGSGSDWLFDIDALTRTMNYEPIVAESDGFEQIVDFLNAHPIRHALTINPTIYISCIELFWSTIMVKTINGEAQLHALVDGKKIIITESSVRRDLQLADEEGEIDAIDADEEITLVSVHDVNVSAGEEVFATTVDDITLAQVLEEMKSTKPKKKGF
ncbi:hypothetical protein Tco_1109468 [Tanacetum coccineum]